MGSFRFFLVLLFGLVVSLVVSAVFAQRRVTLTSPEPADPRTTTYLEIIHLSVDFRDSSVVLTMQGEGGIMRKLTFEDAPAVLDDMGMEVTPAVTDGTDMLRVLFPGNSLRGVTQRLISAGKLNGTVDP